MFSDIRFDLQIVASRFNLASRVATKSCAESLRLFLARDTVATMTRHSDRAQVTVWYDSDCPLCLREIALMRRLDTRQAIDFVDLYSADGCPIDQRDLLKRFHAQEYGKSIVSGAAAFAAMWRVIPVLRPFGLLARYRPVLWCLEAGYRLFLLFRPSLQRVSRLFLKTQKQ